ncbi:SAG family member [Eimeria tenella]|uniref:SAG family member n=1 Tax=Eimeria tenella TaxID=5802 RepID=U6KK34_EIMTE|nr:SAG family member [Eimeria tenella]CDJ37176.1 SAG family member [Eimeria tenella]|eukprot:XP_013228014.1 SAG family member [Eimeria tenella]
MVFLNVSSSPVDVLSWATRRAGGTGLFNSNSPSLCSCLLVLHSLRREGLNGLLNELATVSDDEVLKSLQPEARSGDKTSVIEIAQELSGGDKSACDAKAANKSPYSGFVITFDHSTKSDCEALISASFTAGLSHLQQQNYDASADSTKLGEAPWDNLAAKNLAAIVSTKAEKVSCAATAECEAGSNVLFCYFIQPLALEELQPIKAEVYEALLRRQHGSAYIPPPGITAALFTLTLAVLS